MVRYHVMFVHAHPDDESSKGAATIARYVAESHRVSVVTCTDGSRGRVLNPDLDLPEVRGRLAQIRARELDAALAALGVTDHYWLGYPDSGHVPGWDGLRPLHADAHDLPPDGFFRADLDEATRRLVSLVRAEQPDVLVTYPPDGDCPHPDHVRTHQVTVRRLPAAWQRARPVHDAHRRPRPPPRPHRSPTRPRHPDRPLRSVAADSRAHHRGGLPLRGLHARPQPGRRCPARDESLRRARRPHRREGRSSRLRL